MIPLIGLTKINEYRLISLFYFGWILRILASMF